MSQLFLGLLFSYLISGSIQHVSSSIIASSRCYVCDSDVICGHHASPLPDCIKGSPCTKEQQEACNDIFPQATRRVCDQPGIFPDNESTKNYYKCWISSNSDRLLKQKIRCQENTIFDQRALLCLNEEERKIMKRIEILPPGQTDKNRQISCEEPGLHSYPQDCKKYYYCDDQLRPKVFHCPFGTYYSHKIQRCTSKLTPYCKSQLNRVAAIQRLNSAQLLSKIKSMSKESMSKESIPPGVCMRFCENNWPILSDTNLKGDEDIEDDNSTFAYKVSLGLLNRYEQTVLQLNAMVENITREEKMEMQSSDTPKPKKLRGFFLRLIIRILIRIIYEIRSFLRQYIRERICPYLLDPTTPYPDTKNNPQDNYNTTPHSKGYRPGYCNDKSGEKNPHSFCAINETQLPHSCSHIRPIDIPTDKKQYNPDRCVYPNAPCTTTKLPHSYTTPKTEDGRHKPNKTVRPTHSTTETTDLSEETTEAYSSTSSEPTEPTLETTETDFSTSSEFTESTLETTEPDSSSSFEPTESTLETTEPDPNTSLEPTESTLETTEPDSSSSFEPTESTLETTEPDSSSSFEPTESTLETTEPDSSTSFEPTESTLETTEPDSSSSFEPTEYTSETTETDPYTLKFSSGPPTTSSSTTSGLTETTLKTPVMNSTVSLKPANPTAATTGFDSVTQTDHLDCTNKSTGFNTNTSDGLNRCTNKKAETNATTSLEYSSTSSGRMEFNTTLKPLDVSTVKSQSVSEGITQVTDSENKRKQPDSGTEPSGSTPEPHSHTSSDAELSRLNTTLEPSDVQTKKERTNSSAAGDTVDSSTQRLRFNLPASEKPSGAAADSSAPYLRRGMEFNNYKRGENKSPALIRPDISHSTNRGVVSDSSISEQDVDPYSELISSQQSDTFEAANLNKENSVEDLLNENKSFKCPQVGVFRDPEDCHSYYRCIRKRVPVENCPDCREKRYSIIAEHHTCKHGKYFSSSLWKCIKAKPVMCP